MVASVQADSQKIGVTGCVATSYGTSSEITPEGREIDWLPFDNWVHDDPGMVGWTSAANADWGSGNQNHNPDKAPFLIFFFDDVYWVDTVSIVNHRLGGNAAHSASWVNVYVLDDGAWVFSSTTLFPPNNRWDPTGELEYQTANPFEFDIGMEASAVKFEFVTCGGIQFLNSPYGYNEEVGFGTGPNRDGGPWEFKDNPGDCYVGLNNVTFFGTPVPEPVTMSLLVLGGLAMLRRRGR